MKDKKKVFQTFSLVSQLGLSMIAPILLCTIAGVYLEERFSIPFTIPFIILGVLTGARNAYVLIRHASKTIISKEDEEE